MADYHCPTCGGTGQVNGDTYDTVYQVRQCPQCQGLGIIYDVPQGLSQHPDPADTQA